MIALQETTRWSTPNHIYIVNDSRDKLHAYVVGDELRTLLKPARFSTVRRKFVPVENTWLSEPDESREHSRQVVGSNGAIYTVVETEAGTTCSCPGFKFRGTCKHIG